MSTLAILKLQLEEFFEKSKSQTITQIVNKENANFNVSLYELEKQIVDLKKKYNVNQNINTEIISDNILNSFSTNSTFFRSNDFALSFLVFLSQQDNHDAEELLTIMFEYLELVKEKLSFQDMIKTRTGVTRCFTNLRFAALELRKFGLLYNKIRINNEEKRTLLPTPVGYLIALSIVGNLKENPISHLPPYGRAENNIPVPLYEALKCIKNGPEMFLKDLIIKFEEVRPLSSILKAVLDDYYTSILQHIHITDDGLKVDEKELEKAIKSYYAKIILEVDISRKLKAVFLGKNPSGIFD